MILVVGIGSVIEEELGAVGVTEADTVEEGRAAAGIGQVDVGPAQGHQSLDTVAVASTGRTMQRCQKPHDLVSAHHH